MTALQDWLNIPSDPRSIKELIWDVIRGRTSDEPAEVAEMSAEMSEVAEPVLMGRGLERC
jgi:hypothetical protein